MCAQIPSRSGILRDRNHPDCSSVRCIRGRPVRCTVPRSGPLLPGRGCDKTEVLKVWEQTKCGGFREERCRECLLPRPHRHRSKGFAHASATVQACRFGCECRRSLGGLLSSAAKVPETGRCMWLSKGCDSEQSRLA